MQQRINYQIVLEKELSSIQNSAKFPRLLLHACCAPCSSYVLEYLSNYFDITLFFYNPNISPETEFNYRVSELLRLADELPLRRKPETIIGTYHSSEFYEIAKGLEREPEGGKRCANCYRLRLEACAKRADADNFDYFTTTLSISPYKNALLLNQIGKELADIYRTKYLYSDFKKKGGYARSIQLSKEYKLYRQDYCGCIYSKQQRECMKEER